MSKSPQDPRKPENPRKPTRNQSKRLIILANMNKPQVTEALREFRPWLADRAQIVAEANTRDVTRDAARKLPKADLAVILGGDGTVLAQARALVDVDISILGINFGKLGFLAEFNLDDVDRHWDAVVNGTCRISKRMMLEVSVYAAGTPDWGGDHGSRPEPIFNAVAMNDAVITAGPPFRLIETELTIEPQLSRTSATTFISDGVIVATPSGSTAYNLAAGGPIVSPGIDGLCITAICPQSLAAHPIVCNSSCDIWLGLTLANEGTTLVLDGQESCDLVIGQQVLVRKYRNSVALVHNPDYNYWTMLAHKMHWAARPRRT